MKDNLRLRGFLPVNFVLCLEGSGKDELINHLFLGCDFLVVFDISFVVGWTSQQLLLRIMGVTRNTFLARMFAKRTFMLAFKLFGWPIFRSFEKNAAQEFLTTTYRFMINFLIALRFTVVAEGE